MNVGPKVLYLDTENSPNIAAVWGIHDQKLYYSDIVPGMEWFLISAQWSWDDSKQINSVSILDEPKRFKRNFRDDYHVVKTIHKLLSEADIVVGHHIKGHDLKKIQAKIIEHRLPPLKIPLIVDTYQWSKTFGFTSRKLKDLCSKLDLTQKLTHDPGVFIRAAFGDKKSIANIVTYGLGDIPTLRDLYHRLKPYAPNHPNHNLFRGDQIQCCPRCSSNDFTASGWRYTSTGKFQRYKCKECGHWFSSGKSVKRVIMR